MAFNINNFLCERRNYNTSAKYLVPTEHFYKTEDSINLINSTGYFNELKKLSSPLNYKDILIGDIITIYFINDNKVVNFYIKDISENILIAPVFLDDTNDYVRFVNNKTGIVTLTKEDIGLGNVINEEQIPISQINQPNGVPGLIAGQISINQLPPLGINYINGFSDQANHGNNNGENLYFFSTETNNIGILSFITGVVYAIGVSFSNTLNSGNITLYPLINNVAQIGTGQFITMQGASRNSFVFPSPVAFNVNDRIGLMAACAFIPAGTLRITLWIKLDAQFI